MARIDIAAAPRRQGSGYPPPHDAPCAERVRQQLGEAGGLTHFGVNLLTLPPGAWSSQRHWHSAEDEFVFVLEGEVALVTDASEETLKPGDCAAFPAGAANGHHLINRGRSPARVLEVGDRSEADRCVYSDIDMVAGPDGFRTKAGAPYPSR